MSLTGPCGYHPNGWTKTALDVIQVHVFSSNSDEEREYYELKKQAYNDTYNDTIEALINEIDTFINAGNTGNLEKAQSLYTRAVSQHINSEYDTGQYEKLQNKLRELKPKIEEWRQEAAAAEEAFDPAKHTGAVEFRQGAELRRELGMVGVNILGKAGLLHRRGKRPADGQRQRPDIVFLLDR